MALKGQMQKITSLKRGYQTNSRNNSSMHKITIQTQHTSITASNNPPHNFTNRIHSSLMMWALWLQMCREFRIQSLSIYRMGPYQSNIYETMELHLNSVAETSKWPNSTHLLLPREHSWNTLWRRILPRMIEMISSQHYLGKIRLKFVTLSSKSQFWVSNRKKIEHSMYQCSLINSHRVILPKFLSLTRFQTDEISTLYTRKSLILKTLYAKT